MNTNDFNNIEWNKIFMAIAMALVFLFQAVDQIQHNVTIEVQKEHAKELEHTLTKAEIILLIQNEVKK